jgi:hypothetical protein
MKSECGAIIHKSLQSMKFSRKRHRVTKSDGKGINKALKQSKERKLAQEHKSEYSENSRKYEKYEKYEKMFGDKLKNEGIDNKLQKATV